MNEHHRHYIEWLKQDVMHTYCRIPFIWNLRTGKTNWLGFMDENCLGKAQGAFWSTLNWVVVTWLYTYVTIHQAVETRFLRFIHSIICRLYLLKGFPGGSVVKNPPAMQETQFNPWVGKIPWRRKWQLTPVTWPEKSCGQRRLADYSLWGHTSWTQLNN